MMTVVREYDDGRSRRVVCRPRRPRGPLGSGVDSLLLTLGTRSRDSDHAECEGVSLVTDSAVVSLFRFCRENFLVFTTSKP